MNMNKRIRQIALVLLCFLSGKANAEWINVAMYRNITLYVESDTVRKKGSMVKMWSMLDLKVADTLDGASYKSIKTLNEFDCKGELNRMLYSSYHTENMGEGDAFSINSVPSEMMPVPPSSGNSVLWKIACGQLRLP